MNKKTKIIIAVLISAVEEIVLAYFVIQPVGQPWDRLALGKWSWLYTNCLPSYPKYTGGVLPLMMSFDCSRIAPLKVAALIVIFLILIFINRFVVNLFLRMSHKRA